MPIRHSDYYAANGIAIKVFDGMRIKDILLGQYNNNIDEYNNNISKYQNPIQLLGGIMALNDSKYVAEHGKDIIDILIDRHTEQRTMVCNLL